MKLQIIPRIHDGKNILGNKPPPTYIDALKEKMKILSIPLLAHDASIEKLDKKFIEYK